LFEVVLVERKERLMHTVGQLRAVVDLEFGESTLIPYDGLLNTGTIKQAAVTEIREITPGSQHTHESPCLS
jgi:hypothetical protein